MNTMTLPTLDSNLDVALRYYDAMLNQRFDEMAEYLHENVEFIGPLANMNGKNEVVEAAKGFSGLIAKINIRSKCTSENQVMLAYDFIFHQPTEKLRAAVLMDFKDNVITRLELFFDSKPFTK